MEFLASKHNRAFHPIMNPGNMKYLPSQVREWQARCTAEEQGTQHTGLEVQSYEGNPVVLLIPKAGGLCTRAQSERLTLLSVLRRGGAAVWNAELQAARQAWGPWAPFWRNARKTSMVV